MKTDCGLQSRGIGCRYRRLALLAAAFLLLCWLTMQIVHEAGHVLAAWITGGKVTTVVMHPLTISRTDVLPNPRPLIVVWGGPIVGSALPLVWWTVSNARRWHSAYLWRFFAGFCLVANGAYLGYGVFEPVGDAIEVLRHGGNVWQLAVFAIVTVPSGFALRHREGPHFGLGQRGEAVRARHIVLIWVLLAVVVAGEMLWTRATSFR